MIIDCGLFQGSPPRRRNRCLAYDPATIDAILLTHAHLDHCGFLPVVVREGYAGPVFATPPRWSWRAWCSSTGARCRRSRRRSAASGRERQAAAGGAARRRSPGSTARRQMRTQPPDVETEDLEPLYDEDEAARAWSSFVGLRLRRVRRGRARHPATLHDAGHILGSAIIVLDVEEGERTDPRIVFSGDLGRPGTPILRDPTSIIDGADYVLMESTYGGREHEPAEEAIRLLAEAVTRPPTSGVLLIPAFAIGRTQEIVWPRPAPVGRATSRTCRSTSTRRWPRAPATSTAASRATTTRRRSGCSRPARPRSTTPTPWSRNADESSASAAPRPMIIVASSGMLTGGRVVHHLRDLIDDPDAMLLFVGYQGEGTLGAHLQAGARRSARRGADPRCAARSGRSAASPPTPTNPSCSTGSATSPAAAPAAAGVPRPRRPRGRGRAGAAVRALGLEPIGRPGARRSCWEGGSTRPPVTGPSTNWDRVAAAYATSPIHAAGPDLAWLVEALEPVTGLIAVLDLGCGAGPCRASPSPQPAPTVMAVDASERMLETGTVCSPTSAG